MNISIFSIIVFLLTVAAAVYLVWAFWQWKQYQKELKQINLEIEKDKRKIVELQAKAKKEIEKFKAELENQLGKRN